MYEPAPELVVTNFNRNFTGVSSTADAVTRHLLKRFRLVLCGHALPGLPPPIGRLKALGLSRRRPADRPFVIWHVRRNAEMVFGLLARDVLRLPVRLVFTSAAQRLHSALPRALIARMDAVVATTQAAADFVPGVVGVVPHGVDTETFRPPDDREAAWASTGFPGKRGVVCIGRVRPEKGTDLFVDAMVAALPGLPDTTAVVFGAAKPADKAFQSELQARVASAGLSERILFAGEVPQDELRRMLPAFSLLVSVPRYEGYGMTVLEGMACGVPFVATDSGIFPAASKGGSCGEIVDMRSDAVADAVADWMRDAPRLQAGALVARKAAVEDFSVRREADSLAEIYDALWAKAERQGKAGPR
jgi:mannosyltransferase